MSRKDDFMDFMIFNEVMGDEGGSSGSGSCGCCCMPVLIIVGMIIFLVSLV